MNLIQFDQNYYFHDSVFEKSEFDAQTNTFTISCRFCNFMQKYYRNGQPENSDILLIFQNADFSCHVFECEVLTQKLLDDRTICFFLVDEYHADFFELRISADSVQLVIVNSYSF